MSAVTKGFQLWIISWLAVRLEYQVTVMSLQNVQY